MTNEDLNLEGFEIIPPPSYAVSLISISFDAIAETNNGQITCSCHLPDMSIVQYYSHEEFMVVATEELTLKMEPSTFTKSFLPLPNAPADLRYCSFDEYWGMEPGDYWIFDFKSQAFFNTATFIEEHPMRDPQAMISAMMIERNYNENNYGATWIALIPDE